MVGEPQILGQVKEAYATARAVGAVNSQLDALLTRAFAVAKRVRTETAIATSAVSVASVAVDLAKKIFGNLQGKSVYLVGAGKMCELAAPAPAGPRSRRRFTLPIAPTSAPWRWQRSSTARRSRSSSCTTLCRRADIVISSTGAPHAIFRKEHGEKFLEPSPQPSHVLHRHRRAARHRSGDEQAGRHLRLRHRRSAAGRASHIADRRVEADRAEAIVQLEVDKFQSRLQTLDVVPTIVSLQEHLETVRQAEIDRVRGRLGR